MATNLCIVVTFKVLVGLEPIDYLQLAIASLRHHMALPSHGMTSWGLQFWLQNLWYSWFISGLTMVYGRYNYSIHGNYFMVYKPTNTTGGPHPVRTFSRWDAELW